MILLAWAATLYVVASYVYLARTGFARPFHWANVVGSLILAPLNLAAGLPPQALLNSTFGLVAALALWKEYRRGDR